MRSKTISVDPNGVLEEPSGPTSSSFTVIDLAPALYMSLNMASTAAHTREIHGCKQVAQPDPNLKLRKGSPFLKGQDFIHTFKVHVN